jgi:TRAP-type mannitol/chloroaromatic compound transport system substrate-binding protein
MTTPAKNEASTRHFLKVAAAGSAATVAVPSIVNTQVPVRMRFQSTWPSKDIFHDTRSTTQRRSTT